MSTRQLRSRSPAKGDIADKTTGKQTSIPSTCTRRTDSSKAAKRGRQALHNELDFTGNDNELNVEDDSGDGSDVILEDLIDDIELTPRIKRAGRQTSAIHPDRSIYTQAIALRQPPIDVYQSRSPSASEPSKSLQSTSSQRSRSPVKTLNDLEMLETPVYWDVVSSQKACIKKVLELCPEHKGLVNALAAIATDKTPYIPQSLQKELEEEDDFAEKAFITSSDDGEVTFQQRMEQITLKRIIFNSQSSAINHRSEPAWNEQVHYPMLQLATENTPDVTAENISRASIVRTFLPAGTNILALPSGRMVDYALALQLPQPHPLRRRLGIHVRDNCDGDLTFNQTAYFPLVHAPAGVFIETKADGGSANDGQVQLGLWVASWFKRIRMINTYSVRLPFLPLLLIEKDQWNCFFACYAQDVIQVVGPLNVGNTAGLAGSYRLLAALRELSRWVNDDFRGWVKELVGFS